ncbi:hypothetical protein BDR06DRAFT_983477 [Suillus hirtellus]|nr:hypothetical protein BDR06DRAFT_983477 [Suillus hirtellus]
MDKDLERVMSGMRECYRASLLVFHIFCDIRIVPEEQHCPADTLTVLAFITSSNYVYAICAWHILHGQTWGVDQDQLKAALDGAITLASRSSKQAKCAPFTAKHILDIQSHLDSSLPLDVAVLTCMTSTFYSLSHLREFTVRTITGFDGSQHVKRSDMTMDTEDCNDHTNPKMALINHFAVNDPAPNEHLFAWHHPNGMRPLTCTTFLKRMGEIIRQNNMPNLKGHGLRIGGTLEYLLRGIPFDVIKSMGRWSSDAFTGYLHQHAMIMAPYLQESPALESFTCYTMPPIH